MGAVYKFVCHNCGYRVESEGGFGGGFLFTSQDVICHDCREIRNSSRATVQILEPAVLGDPAVTGPPTRLKG